MKNCFLGGQTRATSFTLVDDNGNVVEAKLTHLKELKHLRPFYPKQSTTEENDVV